MLYTNPRLAQAVAISHTAIADAIANWIPEWSKAEVWGRMAGRKTAQMIHQVATAAPSKAADLAELAQEQWAAATTPEMIARYRAWGATALWGAKLAAVLTAWAFVTGCVFAYEAGKACAVLVNGVSVALEGGDAMSAILAGETIIEAQQGDLPVVATVRIAIATSYTTTHRAVIQTLWAMVRGWQAAIAFGTEVRDEAQFIRGVAEMAILGVG